MKTIISIDPGSKGFVSVLFPDESREFLSIEENNARDIANFLKVLPKENTIVVMEEVHAIMGSSAKGTFSFGEIFGLLKGFIIAYGFSFALVQPKDWQKEIWINEDKVVKYGKVNAKTGKPTKVVDTKATSLNAVKRLFPDIDLRKNERCRMPDDNKVDAILIGEYARRANL